MPRRNPAVFERLPSLAKFYRRFRKLAVLESALLYLTFFLGSFFLVLLAVQASASIFLRSGLLFIFSAGSLNTPYFSLK